MSVSLRLEKADEGNEYTKKSPRVAFTSGRSSTVKMLEYTSISKSKKTWLPYTSVTVTLTSWLLSWSSGTSPVSRLFESS
ncbi:hypothetical protein OGATHE_000853 [Ogataea polymorpha]|uniref:Uncharacterized protein n=1 Tax=Ogataea polymorpha TaxID=460523 RepID=A0A9P8PU07_9ASCO|nr:hypothetical protein OGATHE_000853 [Ogataea polymorpha]